MLTGLFQKNEYKYGTIYVFLFVILAAILNYFMNPDYNGSRVIIFILIWTLLYIPMLFYIIKFKWKISDFGFIINIKILMLIALAAVIDIIYIKLYVHISSGKIYIALLETYARTGEEILFRGFSYSLLLKIFSEKKRPYMWAIIISSLLFALLHTQTFLPGHGSDMLGKFAIAVLLAALRYWTGSIAFGVIFHCGVNGGSISLLSGIIVYLIISLFPYKRSRTLNHTI